MGGHAPVGGRGKDISQPVAADRGTQSRVGTIDFVAGHPRRGNTCGHGPVDQRDSRPSRTSTPRHAEVVRSDEIAARSDRSLQRTPTATDQGLRCEPRRPRRIRLSSQTLNNAAVAAPTSADTPTSAIPIYGCSTKSLDTTVLNQLGQAPVPSSRGGLSRPRKHRRQRATRPHFHARRATTGGIIGARVIIQRVQHTLSLGQCTFRVHNRHVRSIG